MKQLLIWMISTFAAIGIFWTLRWFFSTVGKIDLWRSRVVNMYNFGYSKYDNRFTDIWNRLDKIEYSLKEIQR